jgi:hypothetical protein
MPFRSLATIGGGYRPGEPFRSFNQTAAVCRAETDRYIGPELLTPAISRARPQPVHLTQGRSALVCWPRLAVRWITVLESWRPCRTLSFSGGQSPGLVGNSNQLVGVCQQHQLSGVLELSNRERCSLDAERPVDEF